MFSSNFPIWAVTKRTRKYFNAYSFICIKSKANIMINLLKSSNPETASAEPTDGQSQSLSYYMPLKWLKASKNLHPSKQHLWIDIWKYASSIFFMVFPVFFASCLKAVSPWEQFNANLNIFETESAIKSVHKVYEKQILMIKEKIFLFF